jgi:type IV pilus assembly protein PilV
MKLRARPSSHIGDKQRGMTLIEVLVTLVSASVGLLGVAALQLVSLKTNQEALTNVAATALASSMLEHIRVHRHTAQAGSFDHVPFNGETLDGSIRGRDLADWQQRIDERLPGGAEVAAGSITRMPGTNVFEVKIRWAGAPERNGGVGLRHFAMRTEP